MTSTFTPSEAMIEAAARAFCRSEGLTQNEWIVIVDEPGGKRMWAGHNEVGSVKDGERAIQLWDWFGRRHAEDLIEAIAPFLCSSLATIKETP